MRAELLKKMKIKDSKTYQFVRLQQNGADLRLQTKINERDAWIGIDNE